MWIKPYPEFRQVLLAWKKETEPLFTSSTMANLHWASLYSRFSTACIVWFQKRDIRQVSSGWKKKWFSCFICKPPDSSSPPSPIQETLQGKTVFSWARAVEKDIRLDLGKGKVSLSLYKSHAVKSNQTRCRKAFWRPWPWLNWPSL